MRVSLKGLELIKSHEGLRLKAYKCPAGVWTIGYGSTGPHVKPGMVISRSRAEELLRSQLNDFENGVENACKPAQPNQFEFDAMVSLAYNIGLANFRRSSVLKAFKRGDKSRAAAAFLMWTKARDPKTGKLRDLPGLVRRRNEESHLFLANPIPYTEERRTASNKVVKVPEGSVVPEAPKPLTKSREIIGGGLLGAGGIGQVFSQFSASDASELKQGIVQVRDESHGGIIEQMYIPEIASAFAVGLSMFIIWKRFADRKNGIR